jgi:hypothetical protein
MVLSISVIGVIQLVAPALMTRNGRITVNRMDAIRSAVTTYKSHHGGTTRPSVLAHLVTTDGGAACAIDNNTASATYKSLQGWCGPYLDVVFQEFATEYKTDGWGTEFRWVQATGALTSCGSNRTCGDSDDIAYTL